MEIIPSLLTRDQKIGIKIPCLNIQYLEISLRDSIYCSQDHHMFPFSLAGVVKLDYIASLFEVPYLI